MSDEETTRRQIAHALREAPETASSLSKRVGVPTSAVYGHLRHVAQSVNGGDETFLVSPPECAECGFSGFDDPVNRPSRCPECRSERVAEPAFTIE